jgi:Patatin-like phospholipase
VLVPGGVLSGYPAWPVRGAASQRAGPASSRIGVPDDGTHDLVRQRRGGSEPLSAACQRPAALSGSRSRLNRRVLPVRRPVESDALDGCTREVMDRRALVLGGGGVTGIAWETGVIAGLADQGIDLAAAEVIIGTSAGSVVGADIACGREPETLYRAQLAPPDPEPAARIGWASSASWCGS